VLAKCQLAKVLFFTKKELEQLLNHFLLDMFPGLNNYLLKINHILALHLLVKSQLANRHLALT
jgi:hypothetical protein